MRYPSILILFLTYNSVLLAQTEGGVEQYHYLGLGEANTIVPVVHMQSKKGLYGEVRYNYDEKNTFSVLFGKSFSRQQKIKWSVTPMVGVAMGNLNGFTAAVNIAAERERFFVNSQSQATVSTTSRHSNFLFNWCEFGYQPLNWLYAGVSLQHTQVSREKALWEPGILIGIIYKKLSFPIYIFNTFSTNRFFILGVNWEWKR